MKAIFLEETSRGLERISAEDKLLKERKIIFTEDVNSESASQLIAYLMCLESEDEESEISIYINSPGGEVISGLAVYDTIMGLKCPVRTVCIGTAASMGAILFLAGEKREMLPHTKIMIHDPLISNASGIKKALELEKEASDLMETRRIIGEIIAKRIKKPLREVYKLTKEDTFLNIEEAMKLGVATAVVDKM